MKNRAPIEICAVCQSVRCVQDRRWGQSQLPSLACNGWAPSNYQAGLTLALTEKSCSRRIPPFLSYISAVLFLSICILTTNNHQPATCERLTGRAQHSPLRYEYPLVFSRSPLVYGMKQILSTNNPTPIFSEDHQYYLHYLNPTITALLHLQSVESSADFAFKT